MQARDRTLDPSRAVLVGNLAVNLPVFLLLLGPPFLAVRAGMHSWLVFLVPASFVVAWAWWSFTVPRWRLWAYERVPSTGVLHERARVAGLVWPHGSFFERTEIKTAAHAQRERDLERRFP